MEIGLGIMSNIIDKLNDEAQKEDLEEGRISAIAKAFADGDMTLETRDKQSSMDEFIAFRRGQYPNLAFNS